MNCQARQHENPAAAKFCLECGGRLNPTCTKCGMQLPPAAKFCLECGEAVAASTGRNTVHCSSASDGGAGPSTELRTGVSPAAHRPEAGAAGGVLPASFVSGRHQVQRLLGEGAKKRVYLAHDTKLDRDVAFALITDNDAGYERVSVRLTVTRPDRGQ